MHFPSVWYHTNTCNGFSLQCALQPQPDPHHSCKNCLTCWLQKAGSLLANISSGAPRLKKIDDSWCKPTVDKSEEVVATIVGDIHSHPLPCITCSQLTFFPLHRYQVNWLTRLATFHHHPNICLVGDRVDHSS